MLKTPGKTRFSDLAMKYKVVRNKKIYQSSLGIDSCLTAVTAKFSNAQKLLKISRNDLFFGHGYEVQSCRKFKNEQSSRCVDSCLTAVSAKFSNTQKCLKAQERLVFVTQI